MESTHKQHNWVRTAGCVSYKKQPILKQLSIISTFRGPVDAAHTQSRMQVDKRFYASWNVQYLYPALSIFFRLITN